jgi:drug/metabolite transporter (DMT)-like permease
VAVALAGVAAIVAGSEAGSHLAFGGASLTGDALVLLATIAWSGYTVLVRPLVRACSPIAVTVLCTAAGAVPLLLLSVALVPVAELAETSRRGWIALAVSAVIGIAVPYFIWNWAIRQIGSARTSLYSYLVPLIALVVARTWLGETLTAAQVVGGALALCGVVVARRSVLPLSASADGSPTPGARRSRG